MQINQREHKTLKILHQIEERRQPLRITSLLHLPIRPDLRGRQLNLLAIDSGNKLLFPDLVGFGPVLVLALHDPALEDYSLHLVDDGLGDVDYRGVRERGTLLADQLVALVLGVVVVF